MIKYTAEKNPHIKRISKHSEKLPIAEEELQSCLTEDIKRLKYQSRTAQEIEDTAVLHWGQRKLLLSEIEFLNTYGSGNQTVLYVGAAPGLHIPYLAALFPSYQFILYDPVDFGISPSACITLYQEYFTPETAKAYAEQYQSKDLLFISDIRTGDGYDKTTESRAEYDVFDKQVLDDLDLQKTCHHILKPAKSLLKFRLPYEEKAPLEYLDGEAYFQAWAPPASTETRLVPHGFQTKTYDPTEYEEQMYYFNQVMRASLYPHGIDISDINDAQGLDHCYDCAREIGIVRAYLSKQNNLKGKALHDAIIEMSKEISQKISQPNQPHTLRSRTIQHRKKLKHKAEAMRAQEASSRLAGSIS